MDNNNPLVQKEILEIHNNLLRSTKYNDPLLAESNARKEKEKKRKAHYIEIREFVDSLVGCDVSIEIMGEWNVIRNDIRSYLFGMNTEITGECPKLRIFIEREQDHLNSIKGKVGKESIEYQMISSIIAQAVVLDCQSNILESEPIIPNTNSHNSRGYVERLRYQKTLKDCLNALANVALFDLEYQYKYESFTPTYKVFSELGEKAGLIENKDHYSKSNTNSTSSNNTGCMGVILLGIITTIFFHLL